MVPLSNSMGGDDDVKRYDIDILGRLVGKFLVAKLFVTIILVPNL